MALRRVMQGASGTLSIGFNLGIVSLAATMNMSPNEVIDTVTVAKRGTFSVLNVQDNATVLDHVINALVGQYTDLSEGCNKVTERVNELEWHASMVRPGELHSASYDVTGLSDNVKVVLSIALCIGTVAGLDVAAIVVRKLLRSLQEEHCVSEEKLDDTHIDSAVRDLYNNLKSGGHTSYLEKQCEFYDDQSGLKWDWQYGHRYRDNITEALVCLTEWAFRCTHLSKNSAASGNDYVSAHQAGASASASRPEFKRWATRSAKVHKACFMLEKMGWNVQASGISEDCNDARYRGCLFLETDTDLDLEFLEVVKGEGNAPKHLRGNGGGVTIRPLNKLTALVGAALSHNTDTQAKVENAWELGVNKGKLCKIVREVNHAKQCAYGLCHPEVKDKPEVPACKWAAKMLVKAVGSKASEYAEEFHRICRASPEEYEELRYSDIESWNADGSPTVDITLAYVIGFIYGEIYQLVANLQLMALFDKIFICWLDSPTEFVYLMLAILIPAEHDDGLPFTEVCRVIAAAYCGDAMSVLKGGSQNDCVGMLTRRGLLLMTGVLDPTANFWHCSNAMMLPHWPLNLVGRDIYVFSADRFFGSDSGIGHVDAEEDLFQAEVHVTPPSTRMSIGCSPNLMDIQGTNMHCMFADGHLMYCGPIMGTIASLYNKVAPCKCSAGAGDKRKSTCNRNDVFVVTDRDLIEENMYVSKSYKTLQDRSIDVDQPPEPIITDSKGVVLVHDNLKWAYVAASVYIHSGFLLAGSCLSCAVDQSQHIVIQCGSKLLSNEEDMPDMGN